MTRRDRDPFQHLWGVRRPCDDCDDEVICTKRGWLHAATMTEMAGEGDDEHHARPRVPEEGHQP